MDKMSSKRQLVKEKQPIRKPYSTLLVMREMKINAISVIPLSLESLFWLKTMCDFPDLSIGRVRLYLTGLGGKPLPHSRRCVQPVHSSLSSRKAKAKTQTPLVSHSLHIFAFCLALVLSFLRSLYLLSWAEAFLWGHLLRPTYE